MTKSPPIAGNLLERFAEELAPKGILTQDQLTLARASVENLGVDLGNILIARGLMTHESILKFIAEQLNIEYKSVDDFSVDSECVRMIPLHIARKRGLIVLNKDDKGNYHILIQDPLDVTAKEEIRAYINHEYTLHLGRLDDIINGLDKHHSQSSIFESSTTGMEWSTTVNDDVETEMETKKIQEIASGPKIISTVNNIIARAKKEGASDIHIEPTRDNCRLRYRIDGILQEKGILPRSMQMPVVSRIKIMAQLDIAERRIPQDGRARVKLLGKPLDMRINTCPTQFGEKVVIRLFAKDNIKTIESLGFLEREKAIFSDIISKPNGIFLVTGPTGSGKSSTLYAGLMRINSPDINIMTIEDPVESEVEGVNQIAVNEKTGLSFAKVLRAALRQDPDVIMIGEIRDSETAEIAVRAAITGHMVLSTLHTNSASGAIDRLKDIGVEPFMIASSLRGVLAQRLVRRLCQKCKEEIATDNVYNIVLEKSFQAKGCEHCNFTGYAGGRVGIFELIPVNGEIRKLIHQGCGEDEITKYLRSHNVPSIIEDGIKKVELGVTTLDEVMRVTAED